MSALDDDPIGWPTLDCASSRDMLAFGVPGRPRALAKLVA